MLFPALLFLTLLGRSVVAQAEPEETELPPHEAPRSHVPSLQVYGGARLGVAGHGSNGERFGPSFGAQLGASQASRYTAVGVEARAIWLNGYHEWLRWPWLELVLKPALGFALERAPLWLYLTLPLGMSAGPHFLALGGTVGLMAGATFFVSKHVGFNAETGYAWTSLFEDAGAYGEITLLRLNLVYGL